MFHFFKFSANVEWKKKSEGEHIGSFQYLLLHPKLDLTAQYAKLSLTSVVSSSFNLSKPSAP